jgi:hypothetical protein
MVKLVEFMEPQPTNKVEEYDVASDLQEYMLNDTEFYRNHYYPCVTKLPKREPNRAIFDLTNMIDQALPLYVQKFEIENPVEEMLTKDQIRELAEQIYQLEMSNCRAGVYDEVKN